jgi:hypothetical protein
VSVNGTSVPGRVARGPARWIKIALRRYHRPLTSLWSPQRPPCRHWAGNRAVSPAGELSLPPYCRTERFLPSNLVDRQVLLQLPSFCGQLGGAAVPAASWPSTSPDAAANAISSPRLSLRWADVRATPPGATRRSGRNWSHIATPSRPAANWHFCPGPGSLLPAAGRSTPPHRQWSCGNPRARRERHDHPPRMGVERASHRHQATSHPPAAAGRQRRMHDLIIQRLESLQQERQGRWRTILQPAGTAGIVGCLTPPSTASKPVRR